MRSPRLQALRAFHSHRFVLKFSTTLLKGFSMRRVIASALAMVAFGVGSYGLAAPQKNTSKQQIQEDEGQAQASKWLPPWHAPRFSFGILPIMGAKETTDSVGSTTTTTSMTEFGLGLILKHIPAGGSNPGLSLSPDAGFSVGALRQSSDTGGQTSENTATFKRKMGGIELTALYRWFRYRFRLGGATLDFDKESFHDIQSLKIINEPAIQLKTAWAALLTLTHYQVWYTEYSDPEFKEADAWLHTRKDIMFLSSWVDVGPGVTLEDQKNTDQSHSQGTSSYVIMQGGLRFFWKLGAQIRFKYVVSASAELDDRYAGILMPDQKVNDASAPQALPKDSLEETAFVGAQNLFSGIGMGYQYHRIVYNSTGQAGATRSISDSGFVVTTGMAL